MRQGGQYLAYRQLRAPRKNRAGLFVPEWGNLADLVRANTEATGRANYDVQGKCLSQLAREAREEFVLAARDWTAAYRNLPSQASGTSHRVFLAGHQPQMFHPGVWLKNFALSHLAEEFGATAINLIVDSDTIRSHAIAVPGGTPATPIVTEIPFDAPGPAVPYEERRILDPSLFAAFAKRVEAQINPLVAHPLMGDYWRHVQDRVQATDRLGLSLAQGRHRLEEEWGLRTLELPQSAVCDLESFRWFACHLLDQSAKFRRIHNEVVAAYRRIHRIRSVAHPVADLAEQNGWVEAPFWIWTEANPRRRRLFVRRAGESLLLTNRHELEFSMPLPSGGNPSEGVQCMEDCSARGIRIRSRALITTMWARLALGDLFVHGIGGAKYDQVTDAIVSQFFNVRPPAYLTVSGTLHLPVAYRDGAEDELRRLRGQLRRLEFQPERFLDHLGVSDRQQTRQWRPLADQKCNWIGADVTPENYRERFLAIRRLNAELQAWAEPIRKETLQRLAECEQDAHAASVLTRREYAFCLFPGEELQSFFSHLLPKHA